MTSLIIKLPKCHLKNVLRAMMIKAWPKNWYEGKTGRKVHDILPKVSLSPYNWGRAEVLFFTGHGPFQYYLKRFHQSHTSNCSCGEEGTPIHYATDCILTTSWHMNKPSAHLKKEWYRSVASNQLSRNKIRAIIAHITNYNYLFRPDPP
ncbi:hypothetical protein AVEN_232421-1 [Araneus ventricosus]|uniref:Uncharacterized protein n=1 Tax=Araneus ventricosus TaxID=182803 RepID=A0A4Y2RZV7_ARAVE|nr:hypothetical protein AVEN_232421-1 [Araneus ventricosus]